MTSRGITFFVEVAGPVQWVPGRFSGPFNGRRFWRVWWLWFSFGKAPVDLPHWEQLIRDKKVAWSGSDLTEPDVGLDHPSHGRN